MKHPLLIVCGLIIVLIIVLVIPRLNFSNPNTTFKKEVMDKVRGKEISAVKLIKISDEKTIALRNKGDISQFLELLTPLQLEKIDHIKDAPVETYSILLLVEGKVKYVFFLYDHNQIQILNTEKSSIKYYKIKSSFELDKFNKYWN
ncbi:hypothetical protein P4H66_08800 [Paenibacillus dokdonensis]|uniref:Uncharacterized protein n=1 Tax=Paenibacillus dokdonensis TaxID=2567944 RepID=A0ABU6GJM5_9BACL|nr:hypothetical protein [Paenibacillus dokdonensis]MEC0239944.1 hypothetical protein [Paenibacillus dokdonensis]